MPSRLLVAAQFSSLAGVVLLGPIPAFDSAAACMLAAALALGAWSIAAVGRRSFRVLPEPKADGLLITAGPYRLIRHPMYASLLIATTGLVFDAPNAPRVGVACALAIVLVVKMRREERLLLARFPDYAGYRARTFRIVPGIY